MWLLLKSSACLATQNQLPRKVRMGLGEERLFSNYDSCQVPGDMRPQTEHRPSQNASTEFLQVPPKCHGIETMTVT